MKRGIDVSSYQGNIDWKKVKESGIDFSILKIIKKDLTPDKQFENNWNGCKGAGIAIQGVYNYSYATTIGKAKTDALKVIEALNGRKTMVWLDAEDSCLENLGKNLISIINEYGKVIKSAGLEFGVYTGEYFYNTYIKPHGGLDCQLWIARYGNNNGAMNEKYKPKVDGMIGWQYTSKGSVSGISGNVDMNVWYEDISAVEKNKTAINQEKNKTIEQLAVEVLNGIWGNGSERKKNLMDAGHSYVKVQLAVNEILKADSKQYHTIVKGDTLSGIAKEYETTVNALVQLNNIKDKNKIYIGQKIRI